MSITMNTLHRKPLPGTQLDYFDTRAAVDAIQTGAYASLPYTSRVLAENLVRRCDPETLNASLRQFIERRRDLDFPWVPARSRSAWRVRVRSIASPAVVCGTTWAKAQSPCTREVYGRLA